MLYVHDDNAHANIDGNEQADALAKWGRKLDHRNAVAPHENTRPNVPCYLQKTSGTQYKKHQTKAPSYILGAASSSMIGDL